jgi:hypothetical protein
MADIMNFTSKQSFPGGGGPPPGRYSEAAARRSWPRAATGLKLETQKAPIERLLVD